MRERGQGELRINWKNVLMEAYIVIIISSQTFIKILHRNIPLGTLSKQCYSFITQILIYQLYFQNFTDINLCVCLCISSFQIFFLIFETAEKHYLLLLICYYFTLIVFIFIYFSLVYFILLMCCNLS